MPGDNSCKFVEVCTLVFQSQDFKWSLTFIFVLTFFFTIPVIHSWSSCRLGLTEQNLTKARLTVCSAERLLRYFYCIFTLTNAVLPSFKGKKSKFFRGFVLWPPLGGGGLQCSPDLALPLYNPLAHLFFVLKKVDAPKFFLYCYPLIL